MRIVGSDRPKFRCPLWLAVAALLWASTPVALAAGGSDQAVVVNGNTLIIGTRQIYLRGVEAPETDQYCLVGRIKWACGKQAARELSKKIAGQPVKCKLRGEDDADCFGGGVNLGAWMVSNGWATASRRVSIYAGEERKAKRDKRGIWRSEFVPPWSWRRGLRSGTSAVNSEARACPIKGDVSPAGARTSAAPCSC